MSKLQLKTETIWDVGKGFESVQRQIIALSNDLTGKASALNIVEDILQWSDERIKNEAKQMTAQAERCGLAASYLFKIAENYEQAENSLTHIMSNLRSVVDQCRQENTINLRKLLYSYEITKAYPGTEDYVYEYIANALESQEAQTALDNNQSVVIFIEGAGQKQSADTRVGALCVVIKKVDGVPKVVFETNRASTLPDYPLEPKTNKDRFGNPDDDIPTVNDGVYKIVKTNHRDRYAALNVRTSSTGDVVRYNNDGYIEDSTSTGINIHHRNTGHGDLPNPKLKENPGSYKDFPSSSGCITFAEEEGSTGDFSTYNEFIEAVTGTKNADNSKYPSEGQQVGVVFIDRKPAAENGVLRELYGDDGYKEILN
ncbi:MAG: hypothetical protein E7554_05960 [Ruminococcaceae bacterium]|nr:hypothetical protein [Oscillospiraceae bacterium]